LNKTAGRAINEMFSPTLCSFKNSIELEIELAYSYSRCFEVLLKGDMVLVENFFSYSYVHNRKAYSELVT